MTQTSPPFPLLPLSFPSLFRLRALSLPSPPLAPLPRGLGEEPPVAGVWGVTHEKMEIEIGFGAFVSKNGRYPVFHFL